MNESEKIKNIEKDKVTEKTEIICKAIDSSIDHLNIIMKDNNLFLEDAEVIIKNILCSTLISYNLNNTELENKISKIFQSVKKICFNNIFHTKH